MKGVAACLLRAAFLGAFLATTPDTIHQAGDPGSQMTPQAYLPVVAHSACPGNAVANGGFEQGDEGWSQSTTGTGWKAHDLIGSEQEGFDAHRGHYAARLGGYEGVWDVLTQTVVIPAGGQLAYWWQMGTYETSVFHDSLTVELLTLEGEPVAVLAVHDIGGPVGVWQRNVVDVSAHGGEAWILRIHAYSDNYYLSWFDVDDVCLRPVW